jgi:antitoxin FitA
MPTLVVKNLPEKLHERLKAQAQQHHRSITKEAISLLEQGLLAKPGRVPLPLPPPFLLAGGPLTIEQIEAAIEDGRD